MKLFWHTTATTTTSAVTAATATAKSTTAATASTSVASSGCERHVGIDNLAEVVVGVREFESRSLQLLMKIFCERKLERPDADFPT
jgi:hypothetical protein